MNILSKQLFGWGREEKSACSSVAGISLGLFLSLCLTATTWAQGLPPLPEPINLGWFPKTVHFAPDESNFIVTACSDTWRRATPQRCTIMRYQIESRRWGSLSEINQQANYGDVAYTEDGSTIFANEYSKCDIVPHVAPIREYCNYLVLLDLNGKKIRNLTSTHNVYAFPSLTRDGKKILFWGVSNQLYGGMGGGAWDVKEQDIASQKIVQKTDYQAAFPKTTPSYMPDGRRLMLAAEEYPRRPNGQDFLEADPRTGELRELYYVSKFGRNMTVVVDHARSPIRPYFPTDGHTWLIVRDISRDGKLAVFDRQGVGMCFRFIEAPLRKEECFTRKSSFARSASIAPSNKTVAVVTGGDRPDITWHIQLITVATGEVETVGMRW